MLRWLLNLLGGSLSFDGWNMPVTGAEGGEPAPDPDGKPAGSSDGGGEPGGDGKPAADGKPGGGSDGKPNDPGGGDFETDLAGKTVEELVALNVKLRNDRAKKNSALEAMKGTKKELDAAKIELAKIAREKMNDDEKLQADAKAAAERANESDASVKKYRIKAAANSTGVKVLDSAFVEYKISEHLTTNPDATDDDLAGVATGLLKSSPIAFEGGNGTPAVDTAGGGAAGQAGKVALQTQLEEVNTKLKNRSRLTITEDALLVAKQVRLEQEIGAAGGAGT